MQKCLGTFPCGLFKQDRATLKWVPACQNKCNAKFITDENNNGDEAGNVRIIVLDETLGTEILNEEMLNPSSYSRPSDLFVSICIKSWEEYGLHCLTKENTNNLVNCLQNHAQQYPDNDTIKKGEMSTEIGTVRKDYDDGEIKESHLHKSSDRSPTETCSFKKDIDDNKHIVDNKQELVLKAIPIVPDDLVIKKDIELITNQFNNSLNNLATKQEVDMLRKDVMERLDKLEKLLGDIYSFQQDTSGKIGKN